MNREDTKILIPVMQAYADGKDIQYKSGCNTYKDGFAPNWNWHDDTDVYRVKPEPVDNIPATEEELKEMFEDRTFFKNKKDGSVGWKYKIREAEIDLERNFVFDHETKCWKAMSSIPTPTPEVLGVLEAQKSVPATEEEISVSLKLIDQYITKEKLTGIIRTSDYLPSFAERYWILNLETKCWEDLTDIMPQAEDLPTMTPKEFEKKHPLYKIVRQGQYYRYFICSNADGSTFILIDAELKRFPAYKNISSIEIYDDLKLLCNHYRKELELESK